MPRPLPPMLRLALALLLILAAWAWFATAHKGALPAPPDVAARRELPAPAPLPKPPGNRTDRGTAEPAWPAFLPTEAHRTLDLIARGGPYPHRQDGNVFQNRERRLPARPRGYYREYTVRTPGERDRGARRIVTGGEPPSEYWYSADHYRSFRRFEVPR